MVEHLQCIKGSGLHECLVVRTGSNKNKGTRLPKCCESYLLRGAQIISMICVRALGLCEPSQIDAFFASFCNFLGNSVCPDLHNNHRLY